MYRPIAIVAVLALLASVVAPAPSVAHANSATSATCGFGAPTTDSDANLSMTLWTAPSDSYDDLRTASTIATAIEDGTVTRAADASVANGDTVVHEIQLNGSATRLFDRLAARNRGSPTANFRALVHEDASVDFRYVGPTACPPELALNETIERGALRVVPDRENDRLFLLVDTDDAMFDPLGDGEPTADGWDFGRRAISLELLTTNGLAAENVTAETDFDVAERTATFTAPTDGLVRLAPASAQTIRGHTTVAPGTEVEVLLRPTGGSTRPLNATATVNQSGRFETKFDLSNVSEGTVYTIRVAGTNRDEYQRSVTLVAVGNATGAAVYAGIPESEGLTLDDLRVATTHGGFAVVQNASGDVVGVSDYLDPGSASPRPDLRPPIRTNQTVSVVLYRDSNGNRTFDPSDEPYRANGSVVRDTTNVTIEGEPPKTPTTRTTTTLDMPEKRTATPTTKRTATPTTKRVPFSTESTTETTHVPLTGFGVVTALVAGLAVIAVAHRQNE